MKSNSLLICGLIHVALSDTSTWTDLRVKYSPTGTLAKLLNTAYFDIPSDYDTAYRFNWTSIDNHNELGLRSVAWHGSDYRIMALYDVNGWIGGIQISVNKKDIDRTGPPSYNISKIGVVQITQVKNVTVYSSTAYFVNPETLANGGRTSAPVLGDGLWLKNGTGYTKVTDNVTEIEAEGIYTKQSCIPAMGTQYYYNMTTASDCDEWQPFFLLANNGSVSGLAWQVFGLTDHEDRNWWDPVTWLTTKIAVPKSNQCLAKYVRIYKATTVFFFFTRQPWKTTCNVFG